MSNIFCTMVLENRPPVWSTVPNLSAPFGASLQVNLLGYASDPEGDPIAFSSVGAALPIGWSIVGSELRYSGGGSIAAYPGIRLRATAAGGSADSNVFSVAIVNLPPVWGGTPAPLFQVGVSASYSLLPFVSDPENDSITFASIGAALPTGVTINNTTKALNYNGSGSIATTSGLQLRATATGGTADSAAFSLVIGAAPIFSTDFDALYAPGFALVSNSTLLARPTQAKPSGKATSLSAPSYTDQRFGTKVFRATSIGDSPDPGQIHLRHEYARRQAWNCDNTRYLAQSTNGAWYLYNASTFAVIPGGDVSAPGVGSLAGLAGDCEPIWHPTDPAKIWYTATNGGLTWFEFNTATNTSSTLFDLTGRLAAVGMGTAGRAWFQGEGRPSNDGRYWALAVETAAFANLGAIMYDRQTDAILGAVLTGGNRPNWTGTSPLGNYIVMSWYGTAAASIAIEEARPIGSAGGVRLYNRDGTFARAVSVLGEHSDLGLDKNGEEIYMAISYRGFADHGGADGLFVRRLSDGVAYVIPGINAYTNGVGFHISGCCTSRPGWMVVSTYFDDAGGTYGGMVFAVEVTPTSPRVLRIAHTQALSATYFDEAHATANRDLTRVMFASDFRANATPYESYMVGLPSWAIPS